MENMKPRSYTTTIDEARGVLVYRDAFTGHVLKEEEIKAKKVTKAEGNAEKVRKPSKAAKGESK